METIRGATGEVRVTVCARTDQGRRRRSNQDRFLVADLSAARGGRALLEGGEGLADSGGIREFRLGSRGSLILVADGMGGAAGGEVASAMATETIYAALTHQSALDEEPAAGTFARLLVTSVERASRAIHERARDNLDLRGMGTTSTAVGVLDGVLYVAQVGDSRAYLLRGDEGIQITRDQSVVQTMMEAGTITEEQAERSPHSNLILQALGTHPELEVDLTYQELRRGDTVLVCSDGLSGQVRRPEMASIVGEASDLAAGCDALVSLANERGGPDNVTVVLARFEGDGLSTPRGNDSVGRKQLHL